MRDFSLESIFRVVCMEKSKCFALDEALFDPSPVPGLPLAPPWKWALTQAGKEKVLYYLLGSPVLFARNDAIFSPELGDKLCLQRDS